MNHAKHTLKAMTKVSENIFLVDWDYLGETLGEECCLDLFISLDSRFCFV